VRPSFRTLPVSVEALARPPDLASSIRQSEALLGHARLAFGSTITSVSWAGGYSGHILVFYAAQHMFCSHQDFSPDTMSLARNAPARLHGGHSPPSAHRGPGVPHSALATSSPTASLNISGRESPEGASESTSLLPKVCSRYGLCQLLFSSFGCDAVYQFQSTLQIVGVRKLFLCLWYPGKRERPR